MLIKSTLFLLILQMTLFLKHQVIIFDSSFSRIINSFINSFFCKNFFFFLNVCYYLTEAELTEILVKMSGQDPPPNPEKLHATFLAKLEIFSKHYESVWQLRATKQPDKSLLQSASLCSNSTSLTQFSLSSPIPHITNSTILSHSPRSDGTEPFDYEDNEEDSRNVQAFSVITPSVSNAAKLLISKKIGQPVAVSPCVIQSTPMSVSSTSSQDMSKISPSHEFYRLMHVASVASSYIDTNKSSCSQTPKLKDA